MKNRYLKLSLGVGVISIMLSLSAFAGWRQNETGYWWENADGSFPTETWQWLDGNEDGISECYYFNADGYMLRDTVTEDGSRVNADGAWVDEQGNIVTKSNETEAKQEEQTTVAASKNARTAAAPDNADKKASEESRQSRSFKLGDLNVYMINDFEGGSVESNLADSYILKSADGTKSAGIMMVDTKVNKTLHDLVVQMESIGVNFNDPKMKETFINSLNNSFVKLYGNEDSKCDSEYRTGKWRHLHYNEKQFYISNSPVSTDVYFNFQNKKSYTIIVAGTEDPDQFMNNNISW